MNEERLRPRGASTVLDLGRTHHGL